MLRLLAFLDGLRDFDAERRRSHRLHPLIHLRVTEPRHSAAYADPFIAALTFASVLGWGVLLSAGTVLVVQGTLTLGARLVAPVVSDPMIAAATATGGVLLFGLGLLLLDLKEIRVANMLPALVFAPLLVVAAPLWPF